ncbi:MAG: glycosyl transferase [Sulfurimonas sp.]|nr:glycosyl transferase [Sulfurimonas sp.]MDQ7061437.1 glycosyl transferase [Sulfurimonas sp.]
MSFQQYLKAVGTGPKGNKDLSFEQSQDMMEQILGGELFPEQISAFLLGWRLKPETIEEFQGALAACDALVQKSSISNSIELGYPFDGKAKNPYLFPLVSQVLASSDLNLVILGDDLQPAKSGVTTKDICQNIDLLENIKYFDRANYLPELHKLTELRNRLGLRSGLNTIEKLPNVTQSDYAITGVHHKPYVKKYMEIFSSRYKRFALIQGNEGSPELFSKGTLWLSTNRDIEEQIIDPAYYGISVKKSTQMLSLEDSLAMIKNPDAEFLALAKLNAALWLFISEKYSSIDEAYQSLQT